MHFLEIILDFFDSVTSRVESDFNVRGHYQNDNTIKAGKNSLSRYTSKHPEDRSQKGKMKMPPRSNEDT